MEHTNNVNKILDIIFSVKPDILEEVNISILKIMEKTMKINGVATGKINVVNGFGIALIWF